MKMFTGLIRRMASDWTREMFHVKHGEKQMQKNETYSVEITGLTAEGEGGAGGRTGCICAGRDSG